MKSFKCSLVFLALLEYFLFCNLVSADDSAKQLKIRELDRVSLIHAQVYYHYMGSLAYMEGWVPETAPSPDFVFFKINIDDLSFAEKKRLALLVLLTVKLENAGAIEFADWFGDDKKKIGAQLRVIPDNVLINRFGFSNERLKSFKAKVEIFESDDF